MEEYTVKVSKAGTIRWHKNGKLHRTDGPAIEYANGNKEWWVEGKEYTKEEFLAKTSPPILRRQDCGD